MKDSNFLILIISSILLILVIVFQLLDLLNYV
jgi:hypothetical protein